MNLAVEAHDLDTTQRILASVYGPLQIDAHGQRAGMRLVQASLGPVRFDQVSFAMSFEASGVPLEALVFGQITAGRISYGSGDDCRDYAPGQVFLAGQPARAYAATVQDADVELAVFDPALLSQVAATAPDRAHKPVRFSGYDPVSPQAAQTWKATYAYLRDCLFAAPGPAAGPLLTASAANLLVATALATFPNDALTEPTIQDRHDSWPATLRHAISYIDAHAHLNITLADIAAAAHVTIRATQLAFRRHLDTTPLAYLRRVRLDLAHRQLIAADPGRESVAAVASQWGFTSPSRFAAYYRQAYGVPPSLTLRR
ncbi:MAG TPA: helix-turn-helix transcriptional regulator [Streptosporangiaceae bacterium]